MADTTVTGKFVLRSATDTSNPYAARLYGKGITQGRVVFYLSNAYFNRTAFIAILAEGARFPGDLACDSIESVYYAGFNLPEFDTNGSRNWVFHQGKCTKAPDYKTITAVNTSTDVFTVPSHGYSTGDPIALWARGTDVVVPAANMDESGSSFLPLQTNYKYYAWRVDANNIKILTDVLGTPVELASYDITSSGAHLDRLFVYKANAFLFDPDQGKPSFFPFLNFTFSGLSYIEVLLPENLSTGADEPTNLKVVMKGRQMYGLQNSSGTLAFDTGTITAEPNNALVAADALVNDAQRSLTRFDVTTWLAWRDRCDALINWIGGADVPAARGSWATTTSATYNATLDLLTKSVGTSAWDSGVATQSFTADYAQAEARYTGSDFYIAFGSSNNVDLANKQGAIVEGGYLKYLYGGLRYEITQVGVGDKIKIVYENNGFFIYRNGIAMPAVQNTYAQAYSTYYVDLGIYTASGTVDQIMIAPSGTDSVPRQVKRFQGGYVAAQPTPVTDLFESEILLSSASWAEIDGKIAIATEPDRTPCFTFIYDPAHPPSNVAKITVKRKNPEDLVNFWTFLYRDDDDPFLTRQYAPAIDRKALRVLNGNRLVSSGIVEYGVQNLSQISRLSNARVRIETDFDIGFTVEAFMDSLTVCKGSFVHVVAPETGYTYASPALCQVVDEWTQLADVETRVFELQIVTADFYSDTTDAIATPVNAGGSPGAYTPPPIATAMTLTETIHPLSDKSYVSAIDGDVTFGIALNQHARIFYKNLTDILVGVTYNAGTNQFTKASTDTFPAGTVQISLGSTTQHDPGNLSQDVPYYIVNVSGNTCKLSKTIGGTAEVFSGSSTSDLNFYTYETWKDTYVDVIPDSTGHGAFEILPARAGLNYVRAVTRSSAEVALSFNLHLTKSLQIVGDIVPPDPPTDLTVSFDGVTLTWQWVASDSFGIAGYIIKDEFDRFIAQVSSNTLTYSETANFDAIDRRVYAVTTAGIESATYAELEWFKPPPIEWVNPVGLTINPDNTLTKTAASGLGYNAGAIASKAVLTDRLAVRVSGAPDKNPTGGWAIGMTTKDTVSNYTDLDFCIIFSQDGNLYAYNVYDGGFPLIEVYVPGSRYAIVVTPQDTSHDLSPETPTTRSIITVEKTAVVSGKEVTTVVYTYTIGYDRKLFFRIGVVMLTQGDTLNLDLRVEGDQIDALGHTPDTAYNQVNTTYSAGTLSETGSGGYGTTGANFEMLAAGQDGGWSFSVDGTHDVTVGLGITDPDQSQNIPFCIRFSTSHTATVYLGTSSTGFSTPTVSSSSKFFIGREGGLPVFRMDGLIIYLYVTASTALKDGPLILDVAMGGSGASVSSIKEHFAYVTDRRLDNTVPTVESIMQHRSARVGKNTAEGIPQFDLSSPTTGQTLLFDSKGRLVNSTVSAPGILASVDCSANPNYPAALKGDRYRVSVAGKIGGSSGVLVSIEDEYEALADNAGGTQGSVGSSWHITQGYSSNVEQIKTATFANDDFVQKKAGVLTNRTIAQVKSDLAVPGTTDALSEGSTNLYFTSARVVTVVSGIVLTGLSLVTGTAITAADTILSAFGKLQKQITDLIATVAGKIGLADFTVAPQQSILVPLDTLAAIDSAGSLLREATVDGLFKELTRRLDDRFRPITTIKIACGNTAAAGNWLPDTGLFDTGTQYDSAYTGWQSGTPLRPGLAEPTIVYRYHRQSSTTMTYTVNDPRLAPNQQTLLRIHSGDAGNSWQQRILVNGVQIQASYVLQTDAGGSALIGIKEYLVNTDADGRLVIAFIPTGGHNAACAAIEVRQPARAGFKQLHLIGDSTLAGDGTFVPTTATVGQRIRQMLNGNWTPYNGAIFGTGFDEDKLWNIHDMAVSGLRIETLVSGLSCQYYATNYVNPYVASTLNGWEGVFLQAGINDILAGASAATIESDYTTFFASLDASLKKGLATITPDTALTSGQETVRTTVNAWIRANSLALDFVVDMDGDSWLVNRSSTLVSYDGLHDTQASAMRRAELLYASVYPYDSKPTKATLITVDNFSVTPRTFSASIASIISETVDLGDPNNTSGGGACGVHIDSDVQAVTIFGQAIFDSFIGGTLVVDRTASTTTTSSLTPDPLAQDGYILTALATALTINNWSHSWQQGQRYWFRLKDDGTARAITWDTGYRGIGVTLPTTTVAGKTLYIFGRFNVQDTKLDIYQLAQQT